MRTLISLLLLTATISLFSQTAAFETDGATVSLNFEEYTGTGIAPSPSNGELNSENWSILGMSDGALPFGGTSTDGDFEGQTDGSGVTGGGLYAYNDGSNTALWVQPTSSDFSPGSFVLRLINQTGSTITAVNVGYTLHVLNDGERSNSFDLSYSTDGMEFFPIAQGDFASDEAPDGSLQSYNRSAEISNFNLFDGQPLYLQWSSDDIGGMGSRDEFGLDDIAVTPFSGSASPIVNFANGSVEVDESVGEYFFEVNITEAISCDVEVTIDPSGTSQVGVDFLDTVSGTYSFGDDQVISIPINILDDMIAEGDETIVLNLNASSGDCVVGGGGQLTITLIDNDSGSANAYSIGEINITNPDGNYLFEGQTVEVTGTVYGINLRPDTGGNSDGLQFTINDGTGGIAVFSLLEEFGYTVQEGDIVRVVGQVSNFLGLGEIIPSVLELISSGNPLPAPIDVLELNEESESELVRLEYVQLVDPSQWITGGSDFSVDITNGVETYVMRIDNQVDLYNSDPIGGVFNVVGIGGQFDPDAPFTEGYIIMPRGAADIEPIVPSANSVSFETGGITVDESDAPFDESLEIVLGQTSTEDCVVNVVAHPSTTATIGVDFNLPDSEIVIPANSSSATYTVNILEDEIFEDTESIWLALSPVSGDCQPSIPAFKRISILDDDEPEIPDVSTVGSLTVNDENGVPLSSGFEVSIEGVVYGGNFRPAGLQFTIIDNTGGMGVFHADENLGYTVTEGDRLRVVGTMGHFSGLTQISPTSIEVLSTNEVLAGAIVVNELNEESESLFVSLGCVTLSSPGQWAPGGSGFNVDVTDGETEWTVRIDADIDLYNNPVPVGNFLVSGIGGQFDSSAPFDSGYQLLPRYAEDIDESFCPNDSGIAGFESAGINLFPNPAQTEIRITALEQIEQVQLFNVLGQQKVKTIPANSQVSISVKDLSPGAYFVVLRLASGVYQSKFVKE